jgi:hypothetical protein
MHIDIEVKCGGDPEAHAELVASTLHGLVPPDPQSAAADVGRVIRAELEQTECARPSCHELPTVNFARLDNEQDWTQI